ncbi:chitotriosidase-1 [Patella vulgata]|uniref:chitotriosidase-1 n=1 Tax=Patella vulgata TaxID=6465 RepID=UPI00217FABB4|nr:chitotriosidase-1 [Patella vulgata]XP_050419118.1 chitotriosidase-1 [Patella vulgata]XP_050419119.1 chitotriosidase-1 [Patella vulgata]
MKLLSTILTWIYILPIIGAEFVSLCYFTNWANTRPVAEVRFTIEDIDPYLCTHLIYAFGVIKTDHTLGPMSAGETERYKKFNDLKLKNGHLKTLLSVGGQNAMSTTFTGLSSNATNIDHFANASAKFLRDNGFDGIDVDWEFPGETENTKQQFTALLKGLKEGFDRETKESGKPRLIISIAVAPGRTRIQDGYEVEQISWYVDYINIMAYDYFGPWNKIAGFNSPLNPRTSDPRFSEELNQKWSVAEWLRNKAPKEKIVVGMTGAGASFTLNDSSVFDVGAPVDGGGTEGTLYLIPGRLIYPEICELIKNNATVTYDVEQEVPFAYMGNQWVGYDDIRSIQAKVKWILAEGLAGAMFWSLDFDDFSGNHCGNGKFPLLTTMKNETMKVNTSFTSPPLTTMKNEITNVNPSLTSTLRTTMKNETMKVNTSFTSPPLTTMKNEITNVNPSLTSTLRTTMKIISTTKPNVTTVTPDAVTDRKTNGGASEVMIGRFVICLAYFIATVYIKGLYY